MKILSLLILSHLFSLNIFCQELKSENVKHRSILLETSVFSTSGGKGMCWSPALLFVKNKNTVSIGGIFQQGKIFNTNTQFNFTGMVFKYQRRLAFSDNYSEFFGEINISYRNATSNYEYNNLLEKYDIEVPLKTYTLTEYYAGFGYRSPLKHLIFWSAFIGIGGMHSNAFTEYNHEAIPYSTNINDIGLQLKASLGFRLFPKNNVQH